MMMNILYISRKNASTKPVLANCKAPELVPGLSCRGRAAK
jgi:hypothetical protein